MQFVAHHKGGNEFKLPDGSGHFVAGGLVNYQGFNDELGRWQLPRLLHSETAAHDGGWRCHESAFGLIKMALNRGAARVHPVRGYPDKYLEIADPVPPTSFEVNQITPECVEYWIDYEGARRSIIAHDAGIKVQIKTGPGYTGDGVFRFRFRLNGLTMQGRNIMDGNTVVMTLGNPWLRDSSPVPVVRPVGEVYTADEVIITADLTGLVGDVYIDPGFGPVVSTADALIYNEAPDTPWTGDIYTYVGPFTGSLLRRSLFRFDASAIPAGQSITSSTFIPKASSYFGSGGNRLWKLWALATPDWNWIESQVTWNSYSTGNGWTGGAGALGAIVSATQSTFITPASIVPGDPFNIDVTPITSYGYSSNGGQIDVFVKDDLEGAAANMVQLFTRIDPIAARRPVLNATYSAAGASGAYYQRGLRKGKAA